jgi:glycosyltransferase involved in cell wall biosynthesis
MPMTDKPLNVLHLSTHDIAGGASRAAYRIHESLPLANIDSQMIVRNRQSKDSRVTTTTGAISGPYWRLLPAIDRVCRRLHGVGNRPPRSYNPLPAFGVRRIAQRRQVDAVFVHYTSGGFVTPADVVGLRKPIVMILHDMWPFCGAEQYTEDDRRITEGYTRENAPATPMRFDLDRWVWNRKRKAYRDCKIALVGNSEWTTLMSSRSALFRGQAHQTIHYPLDLDVYQPLDQRHARRLFGLPLEKRLILFGAVAAVDDPRKGFDLLVPAIKRLAAIRNDCELVVFGADEPAAPPDLGLPAHYVGVLKDDYSLAALYNAADVLVVPSRMEAFGQTALESLACGTPCVAFRIGGLIDTISHQINGYLSEPLSIEDLTAGIEWSLDHHGSERRLSKVAREKATAMSSPRLVANRYRMLLENFLSTV